MLKVAGFFRVLDENAQLSITNLAVLAVVVKMILAPALDLSAAAALLTVLASYRMKSYHARGNQAADDLKNIRSDLNKVKLKLGFMPNDAAR